MRDVLAGAGVVLLVVAHGSLVAFLVLGGPLSLRWHRLTWPHVAAIATVAVVFLAGADCPFTTWENELRAFVGWGTYERGFVVHYLIEPFYSGPRTFAMEVLIVAAWVAPTVTAYGLRFVPRHRKVEQCA